MRARYVICSLAVASFLVGGIALPVFAQAQDTTVKTSQSDTRNHFVKKRYSINGEWSVEQVEDITQIRFSEDFKTKGGPDLKVFISKSPIGEIDSKTALTSSRSIGVLKAKSGAQLYTIPEDVDLDDYKSVIIHCEAFSVLWGGFDLPDSTSGDATKTP